MEVPDLIHLEQFVNERFGTDPAPMLAPELLPENGAWCPMTWAQIPREYLQLLSDDPAQYDVLDRALAADGNTILFPVHPLIEHKYPQDSLVRLGRMAVSASYRTVFVEPEPTTPLASLVPDGHIMMVKLHLDDPLPGIGGDRRLTPGKVQKCVELSALLPGLLSDDGAEHMPATILRERFGLVHEGRGSIIRFVPRQGLMPVFSIYSRDMAAKSTPSFLVSLLRQAGWSPQEAAKWLAEKLARPIVAAVLSGFRQGFSLEMHAQNTLISVSSDGNVGDVFFRDLESVVFFPELRRNLGLDPLKLDHLGSELFQEPRNPTRWFNRNMDHDVGRIFRWMLRVLEHEGVFSRNQSRDAARQIRYTTRQLVESFGLSHVARQGRWLPYSLSPYGNGTRRYHYYRTEFR